mgnify:FL=1
MINNKKYKALIVLIVVFLLFVYLLMFHKWNVKVNIQGIENAYVDIDIDYTGGLYTCELSSKKKTYVNGDQLEISCTNNLLSSINKQINYEISGLYTNGDDLDVLFKQWENRKITYGDDIRKDDVVAVFKKIDDNHTSYYYCIVMGPKEFVGYFDRGIVYDGVNKQYVQFLDKEFKEGTFQPTVIHIHDIQVTFDSRLNELDYTCIYVRDDLKFLIR